MNLQSKLDQQKKQFVASASAETLKTMDDATQALRNSDIVEQIIKPGDTLPEFTLSDETGAPVTSTALLAKGPLVINFYRGVW